MKLSAEYEAEQKELTALVGTEPIVVDTYAQDRANFNSFAAIIRKCLGIRERTPTIVNEFVKKSIVHAPSKSSGHRRQKIQLVRNSLGELEQDEDAQTAPRQKKQNSIANCYAALQICVYFLVGVRLIGFTLLTRMRLQKCRSASTPCLDLLVLTHNCQIGVQSPL